MLRDYLPALVFLIIGTAVGGIFVALNRLAGPRHRYRIKSKADPYECGLPSDVRQGFKFGISFYMVAMLFILFDVEAIFLIPWAVVYRKLPAAMSPALNAAPHDFSARMFGFWEMLVYIGIVLVGFFYVWKKGALDWNKPEKADL